MAKHGSRKEAWAPEKPPIASEHRPDFVSSFRPIVVCFQLFGFDVQWSTQQPANCPLIKTCYRLIWLLVNMVAVSYCLFIVHRNVESFNGSRFQINTMIFFAMMAVQLTGIYGFLVLATWKDDGQLVESLRRIETRMPISEGMLKKIRISSITTSALSTILVRTIEVAL